MACTKSACLWAHHNGRGRHHLRLCVLPSPVQSTLSGIVPLIYKSMNIVPGFAFPLGRTIRQHTQLPLRTFVCDSLIVKTANLAARSLPNLKLDCRPRIPAVHKHATDFSVENNRQFSVVYSCGQLLNGTARSAKVLSLTLASSSSTEFSLFH